MDSDRISSQTIEEGAPSAIAQYEKALGELEQIVARLEQGDQSLEQSLQDYERGIRLERQCQKALDEAEQRVNALNDSPAEDDAPSRDDGSLI
ncbi:exodeoxyribonuclease VII small subunit [Guyparkeria sp.]|uniref:exodeoxyribonuclease VII small subunit n=1 Tax=Guyparkeria sp. TaxID=2035736 RepID=UPI0035680E72